MFDFLVIIDFEATCDDGVKPVVTRANQEIIEFPWVVLDVRRGAIVDRQQMYVQPVWCKKLTPFCTKLTGITTEKVTGQPTLIEVLTQVSGCF